MSIKEAEKARILLEERYRDEIRTALEKERKDKSSGGLKAFLNSSFGLWLLSAIFVSGAGTIYQGWQKSRDEEKATFDRKIATEIENRDAISRLDIEISYRLSKVLLMLAPIQQRIDTQHQAKSDDEKHLAAAQLTFGALKSLGSTEDAGGLSLYPEFSSYTLPALLAELRRRLPESDRRPIESSIAAYASISTSITFPKGSSPSRQAGAALFQKVILKRWQGTAFHHIDCGDKDPFC